MVETCRKFLKPPGAEAACRDLGEIISPPLNRDRTLSKIIRILERREDTAVRHHPFRHLEPAPSRHYRRRIVLVHVVIERARLPVDLQQVAKTLRSPVDVVDAEYIGKGPPTSTPTHNVIRRVQLLHTEYYIH